MKIEKMKKKRGISALVATVLLILITIAAAGIIWGVVMPMMQTTMQLKQACMNAILKIEQANTCLASEVLEVAVTRGGEEFEIEEIAFSIAGEGKAKMVTSSTPGEVINFVNAEQLKDVLGPLEKYTFSINLTKIGMVPSVNKLTGVGIAPRVRVGKAVKTCDVTDSIATIMPCE